MLFRPTGLLRASAFSVLAATFAAFAQTAPNLDAIHVRLGAPAYPRMAMDAEGTVVRLAAAPKRVVSLNHAMEEYLYQIAPPEQIVGVSSSAFDELSATLPQVQKYKPAVAKGLDNILALKPDLVLAVDGSSLETVHALQDKGIPVFRFQSTPTALDQIAANISAIGYLTGNDEGAKRELDRFQHEFAVIAAKCAKPHKPARIYAVSMTGFSYGDQTLFQQIIGLVGGVNVAAEGGMHTYERVNTATIATWNPDVVFTWAIPERQPTELNRWLEDPNLSLTAASKNKRIIVTDPHVILPLTSLITGFARLIADTTCPAE